MKTSVSGTRGGSAARAGRLAGLAIERAAALALAGDVQRNRHRAASTSTRCFAGGYDFPGHTEMLAALTGSRVAMMLAVRPPCASCS